MVFKKQKQQTTTTTSSKGRQQRLLPSLFGRSNKTSKNKKEEKPVLLDPTTTQVEDDDSSSSLDCLSTLRSEEIGTTTLKIRTQKGSLKTRYHDVNARTRTRTTNNNSNESSSSSASSTVKKRVNFSQATIHYHNSILGDSPSVSTGMPLALGNELVHQETVDIVGVVPAEEEESAAPPATTATTTNKSRNRGRGGEEDPLVIPAKARKQILLDAGVSQSEMEAFLLRLKISKLPPSIQKTYLKQLEAGGQQEQ